MTSIIFTFLLIFTAQTFAMAPGAEMSFNQEHINHLAQQIQLQQDEGRKIVLVLGDTPPKFYAPNPNHFKFDASNGFENEPYIVYMALWEKGCSAQNFIHGDFNQPETLSYMNSAFSSVFDLITVDWSVRKFMSCTEEQIRLFVGMLKSNGSIVFDNNPCMGENYLQTDHNIKTGAKPLPFKCSEDKSAYTRLSTEKKNMQEQRLAELSGIEQNTRLPHDYTIWAIGSTYQTNYEELQDILNEKFSRNKLETHPSYVQYNGFAPFGAPAEIQRTWQRTLPLTAEMTTLCEASYAAHITEWGTKLTDVAIIESLFDKPLYLSDTRYAAWGGGELKNEHIIRITKK